MPIPTRDLVGSQVKAVIGSTCGDPVAAQNESSNLELDLGMSAPVKTAMAVPYSKISQGYDNGIPVTPTDAGKCTTVGDAIDLVYKRAQGK